MHWIRLAIPLALGLVTACGRILTEPAEESREPGKTPEPLGEPPSSEDPTDRYTPHVGDRIGLAIHARNFKPVAHDNNPPPSRISLSGNIYTTSGYQGEGTFDASLNLSLGDPVIDNDSPSGFVHQQREVILSELEGGDRPLSTVPGNPWAAQGILDEVGQGYGLLGASYMFSARVERDLVSLEIRNFIFQEGIGAFRPIWPGETCGEESDCFEGETCSAYSVQGEEGIATSASFCEEMSWPNGAFEIPAFYSVDQPEGPACTEGVPCFEIGAATFANAAWLMLAPQTTSVALERGDDGIWRGTTSLELEDSPLIAPEQENGSLLVELSLEPRGLNSR